MIKSRIGFAIINFSRSTIICQIFIENAIQNFDINISGDGEEKLDFTYIEDLVQGISLCCTNKNSINLWIVSDNLLRGAALNAVEIAETYYNKLQ